MKNLIVGLDLSLSKTGISVINSNDEIKYSTTFITDEKNTDIEKFDQIINRLRHLLSIKKYIKDVIIEDTYFGKNFKGFKRLSYLVGIVRYWVYKNLDIDSKLMMASEARRLAGINGKCHKAEVQLHVLDKYRLAKKNYRDSVRKNIALIRENIDDRHKIKNELTKISRLIEKETNLDEHQADSVILALAGWRK